MSTSVDRLKELLFEPESAALRELRLLISQSTQLAARQREEFNAQLEALTTTLREQSLADRDALAARIDAAVARMIPTDHLADRVAEILADALRKAEVADHDRMARSVAPLVVKTVHVELANSQDAMVEALYPITGRLVKAYVASAMKDLMDQINRRLENNAVMLRLRSLTTGRSVAELALADSQRLTVDELFLVERGSGSLVLHWPPSQVTSSRDVHMSGVLTAINEFASHTLGDQSGNLRSFELDGFAMYLRGSARHLFAAKCHGTPPPGIEALIDEKFVDMVEQLNRWESARQLPSEATSDELLGTFAGSLDDTLASRHAAIVGGIPRSNPLKPAAFFVALPILAWMAWTAWSAYLVDHARQGVANAISQTPELVGYPVHPAVSAQGRIVTLSGLVPSAAAKQQLLDSVRQRIPDTTLLDRLTVVAGGDRDVTPDLASMRNEIGALGRGLGANLVLGRIEAVRRRLADTAVELTRLETSLTDESQRVSVRNARSTGVRASRVLTTWLDSTSGTGSRTSGNATVPSALFANIAELSAAAQDVMDLIGERKAARPRAVSPASTGGDPASSAALVDDLSAASERLHAAVYAATAYISASSSLPSARERFAALLSRTAIFFVEGTEFRSPEIATARLDELSRHLREGGFAIRVIGHTDDAGTAARNAPLALARAERIAAALVERGVERGRLAIIGQAGGPDISNDTGARSGNRRVVFRLMYDGELDGRR